jgi:hypothetical protein
MAIDTWVSGTLDAAASLKADRADHRNKVTGGTADAGAVTVAIDSALITRMTLLDSLLASIRAVYSGRLPP